MTRQMADDEVLRVFTEQMDMLHEDFFRYSEGHKDYPFVVVRESIVSALNCYSEAKPSLAALQAERDALRAASKVNLIAWAREQEARERADAELASLRADIDGSAFVESTLENAAAAMTDLRKRAERAESALEALRGQVAGLVGESPLLAVARRNIRQFIAKASFASEVDRWSAGQCLDVIEAALPTAAPQEVGHD